MLDDIQLAYYDSVDRTLQRRGPNAQGPFNGSLWIFENNAKGMEYQFNGLEAYINMTEGKQQEVRVIWFQIAWFIPCIIRQLVTSTLACQLKENLPWSSLFYLSPVPALTHFFVYRGGN